MSADKASLEISAPTPEQSQAPSAAENKLRFPISILSVLIAASLLEMLSHSRSLMYSEKIRNTFIAASASSEVSSFQINAPPPKITNDAELVITPENEYLQKDQPVLVSRNGHQYRGTIAEVFTISDQEKTEISYVIVEFPDGTWDGYDPEEVSPIEK